MIFKYEQPVEIHKVTGYSGWYIVLAFVLGLIAGHVV